MPVETRVERSYIPDPDDVAGAITSKTRMLILNSPCNPTGATFPVPLLRELVALAGRHGLLMASDEVYDKIVFDSSSPYPSLLSLEPDRDRVFVFNSLSKTYCMTGVRVGWVVSSHSNWNILQRLHAFTTTAANTPGQWGGSRR